MVELAKRGGGIPGVGLESGTKENAERDARWVGEWADDLTVAIALREWEKAVTLVEQGGLLAASFASILILVSRKSKTSEYPPSWPQTIHANVSFNNLPVELPFPHHSTQIHRGLLDLASPPPQGRACSPEHVP